MQETITDNLTSISIGCSTSNDRLRVPTQNTSISVSANYNNSHFILV